MDIGAVSVIPRLAALLLTASVLQEAPFRWPLVDARKCYWIDVGNPGDFCYVLGWNGCEKALEWREAGTKR